MDTVKKRRIQSVFTVKEKQFITPHYIRIIMNMTDEQAALFGQVRIGAHNKIFIPAPGTNMVSFPDEAGAGAAAPSARRTYTTRHIDYAKREIWIDFAAHGDNGPASYWASRAAAGSMLGIAMKESGKPLFPQAENYLFAGDSTALPVIGAMLEQLPATATAQVILEVFGKEDEICLSSEARLAVQWLYNPHPEQGSRLAATVRESILPGGRQFAFAAAEYDTIRDLKRYFKEELAWPAENYTAVSYWKRGEAEDQSALERSRERRG